jgi:hypothetical protein
MVYALGTPKRHPKSGFYLFRKRVPEQLRESVGKREIKFSLRTRDDADCDRILALVPLPTVKRILDFCGERRHRSLEGLKRSAFEPLWGFMPELGDHPSEAVKGCLQLLDRHAVGTLLRAFSNPGIEKKAIAAIAGHRAALAFSNSIDQEKFRAAAARRRSEKYPPARSVTR